MALQRGWTVTVGLWLIAVSPWTAYAHAIERVSQTFRGGDPILDSAHPDITVDGRYVAFSSSSLNIVDDDSNQMIDVFVRDRLLGTNEIVSIATDGTQGNGNSQVPSISGDGRYVAFVSAASTLGPDDTNNDEDVYVRDRLLGTTYCVSLTTAGVPAGGVGAWHVDISRDGRYIVYASNETTIHADDPYPYYDVFRYDQLTGTTEVVSYVAEGPGPTSHTTHSYRPRISADGRYVAWLSECDALVASDTTWNIVDVFRRDMQTGTTELLSVLPSGTQTTAHCFEATLSAHGQHVCWVSDDTALVSGDHDGHSDIYCRRPDGSIQLLTPDSNYDCKNPALTDDVQVLVFASTSTNISDQSPNGRYQIFSRDLVTGEYHLVSMTDAGVQGNNWSESPAITPEASHVAFASWANNFVSGDIHIDKDIYLAFDAALAVRWPR